MAGYDERDTIFSRMELRDGTSRYGEYYSRHPERRHIDDEFRAANGTFSDEKPLRSCVDSTFRLLEGVRALARGSACPEKLDIAPDDATTLLKTIAESYGAVSFGTALFGEACFYMTRGRGAEYGDPVCVPGRQGIVFAVRMNPEEIRAAPGPRASAEVVNGYARVALIGLVLAHCIRGWGWEASCTMDGRADVVLPIAARFAGLGSIGRSGLLLVEEYGPCIRLGAVVTDLPLGRTPRKACTSSRLCATCNRCARLCPAHAIDDETTGAPRWKPIDDDACYKQWKRLGTDCGLCIANCPLSRIPQQTPTPHP